MNGVVLLVFLSFKITFRIFALFTDLLRILLVKCGVCILLSKDVLCAQEYLISPFILIKEIQVS